MGSRTAACCRILLIEDDATIAMENMMKNGKISGFQVRMFKR